MWIEVEGDSLQGRQNSGALTREVEGHALPNDGIRAYARSRSSNGSYQGRLQGSRGRMRVIRSSLPRIANSNVPVLLRGESGVGKEIMARQLHAASERAAKPFMKVNCAALPSELLESELFGYERGAFTGAYKSTPGVFDVSDGGTLLLDEIGEMNVRLQAKLLHVLQDNEFQRLGGRKTVKVDVRVMAATNCDLLQAISEGRFREDLYYRLNVIQIEIPPLRERKEEIPDLARFFIKKHSRGAEEIEIDECLMDALVEYDWPGNIRQLENAMQRLLVLEDAEELIRELGSRGDVEEGRRAEINVRVQVPAALGGGGRGSLFERAERAKDELEAEAILGALKSTHWHRKRAAALLGVNYKALLYKIKKLGLQGDTSEAYANSEG